MRNSAGQSFFTRSWLVTIGLILVPAVAAGVWKLHQERRFKHFAVHAPDAVYRSAWLEGDAFAELIKKHNIRSVVNLCRPDEMSEQLRAGEREATRATGARLHTVSLPTSIEWNSKTWEPHLAIMRDPGNFPMLVHCQHGVTRTAMFLAVYDATQHGIPAADSIEQMPWFGHNERANVHVRAFARNFDRLSQEHPDQIPVSQRSGEHSSQR